jgi:hypothetical protein
MQTQHQPVADPLAYLLEEAAKASGVDKDGNAPASAVPAASTAAPTNGRLTVRDLKKEDLTKFEQDQLSKGITPNSVKAKLAKKQDDLAGAAFKAKMAKKKELTLGDSIAQKLGMPVPQEEEPVTVETPKAPAHRFAHIGPDWVWDTEIPICPIEGWLDLDLNYQHFEEQNYYNRTYCKLVDGEKDMWELRDEFKDAASSSSPELTPDSSSSSSSGWSIPSHASDVGMADAAHFMLTLENWDESGGVPESMIPVYHGIKSLMKEDQDLLMAEAGDDAEEGQVKAGNENSRKRKAEMDGLARDFMAGYFKS